MAFVRRIEVHQKHHHTLLLLRGFLIWTRPVVYHAGLNLIGRGKCVDTVGCMDLDISMKCIFLTQAF